MNAGEVLEIIILRVADMEVAVRKGDFNTANRHYQECIDLLNKLKEGAAQ